MKTILHVPFQIPRTAGLWLILSVLAAITGHSATVEPVGSALEEPIVAASIPPTRPESPFAATASAIFQWDETGGAWSRLYAPPWTTAHIRAMGSYEKSSKVLYVVHDAGISRTGDGGQSWVEAVPPAFSSPTGWFLVQVDPTERRHAVVANEAALWETSDFGASYKPFEIDAGSGPVLGVKFVPGPADSMALVVVQAARVSRFTGNPLRLEGSWDTGTRIARCAFHAGEPLALMQDDSGSWLLLRVAATTEAAVQPLASAAQGAFVLPLSLGSSSAWVVQQDRIDLVSLEDETVPPFTVGRLPAAAVAAYLHPRQPDALYVVCGNRLLRVSDGFAGASPRFTATVPLAGAQPLQRSQPAAITVGEKATAGRQEQAMDAAILLNQVMASEPSFQQALHRVLENEQANPGQFADWMKKARTRHWMPELKLIGGVRQASITDNLLVSGTDPFGFDTLEDYRLPDRIRNLSYFGIVLQWPLEGLVWDNQMVDISKERRYYFKERRALIEDLAQVYYGRLNRIVEAKGLYGPPSQARAIQLVLEISQMSELLNSFCGEALFDTNPLD